MGPQDRPVAGHRAGLQNLIPQSYARPAKARVLMLYPVNYVCFLMVKASVACASFCFGRNVSSVTP